jgi:N-acetylmuramoyl-L-alanine amidase
MIAICVGHSRPNDSGAASVTGVTEWDYNSQLADMISDRTLRNDGVEAAIELHFNAATPSATGHEWLYWNTSEKGRLFARALRDSFEDCFPQLRSRGIRPRKKGSRGAGFLRLTHCPATIAEPFFGSNEEDWELALKNMEGMATAMAAGIELYKELSERW